MPKSEEGHYELVLGNRQLISGFFVLVILFAIFLTLGYILGRNSVVVGESGTVAGIADDSSRSPVAEVARPATSTTGRPAASESIPEPLSAASEIPAASSPADAVSPAAEKRESTATKPAAVDHSPTTERTREILSGKVQLISPRKGDVFLQVAAIGRAEAELMAEQLQKRSYRVFLSEVPDKDLFRVLIGPFETSARLNDTKKKLSDDGLPSIVQRY